MTKPEPYQVWSYSISDRTLVIRKLGTPNQDYIFYGVDTMDFTEGLFFDTLEISVYEVGANPNHPNIYDLIGTYKDEPMNACVSAARYEKL